jgi:hypothetical protein
MDRDLVTLLDHPEIVWEQTPERLYKSIDLLLVYFPHDVHQQVEIAEQIQDWATQALLLTVERTLVQRGDEGGG